MTDAEIIARGCAGDPAPAVREAREKLTSSASCECGFDVELLRLFAKGYRSSGPAMAVLRAVAAAAAATWVATNAVLIWLALDFAAPGVAYRLAGKFLDAEVTMLDASRWRRKFVFAETLPGIAWAAVVWLSDGTLPLIALACGTQLYFMVVARRLHGASFEALSFQAEKDELIAELEQANANSDLARRRAEAANLAKSGSYKEYSIDIHASGQHLLMLINEILDLSRIEAGHFDLKEEAVALPHLVRGLPASSRAAREKTADHHRKGRRAGFAADLGRRTRYSPSNIEPSVERDQVHSARRNDQDQDRLDRKRRSICGCAR